MAQGVEKSVVSASCIDVEKGYMALHPQKMERSGPRGPEMSNLVERRLLASARETMKGRYGLL